MPTNNPASDFYKPKEGEASIPWRKVNQTQALNLKTQKTHNFKSRTKVFQRI